MVVYEIKDPAAVVTTAYPKLPRPGHIEPTVAVQDFHTLGKLFARREQGKEREGRPGRRMVSLDQAAVREACRLVAQINSQMEAQGTMIHLVLVADEDGFAIDLYDCSDSTVSRCIHDISIGVNDLQILLARLTQKTGIMVDTML